MLGIVRVWLLLGLLAALGGGVWPDRRSEDWADTPEAYFLTSDEMAEWKTIDSREARQAFEERYWLKRDPTQGTGRNEFKEAVLARIKSADEQFRMEGTPGSRTARGFVFIIFGSPARVRDVHPQAAASSRSRSIDATEMESNETISRWSYDLKRTPKILDAVGLPHFEVQFSVEPSRHTDAIQSPGLVMELREKIARQTIVNPDAVPPSAGAARSLAETAPPAAPPAPAAATALAGPQPLPRDVLDAGLRAALDQAPYVSRSGDAVFGDAVLWRDTGDARTLLWLSVPPAAAGAKRSFQGVVRKESGGDEVASFADASGPSDAFSSATPSDVYIRVLDLPPGSYEASVAVTEGGGKPIASAGARISVPDLSSGFAVSPLLLTHAAAALAAQNEGSPFTIGQGVLPPRADATFATSESLWFYVEAANAPDPAKVTLELRLRQGNAAVRTQAPFPAQFTPVGPNRYIAGFEISLAKIAAGDYRLYVLVRDGVSPPDRYALRSADFRVR